MRTTQSSQGHVSVGCDDKATQTEVWMRRSRNKLGLSVSVCAMLGACGAGVEQRGRRGPLDLTDRAPRRREYCTLVVKNKCMCLMVCALIALCAKCDGSVRFTK